MGHFYPIAFVLLLFAVLFIAGARFFAGLLDHVLFAELLDSDRPERTDDCSADTDKGILHPHRHTYSFVECFVFGDTLISLLSLYHNMLKNNVLLNIDNG